MTEAVLLLLLTHQYHSCQQDFQEFLGQIIGKLLRLFCAFFQYVVSAHGGRCDCGGSIPPRNATLPVEKDSLMSSEIYCSD